MMFLPAENTTRGSDAVNILCWKPTTKDGQCLNSNYIHLDENTGSCQHGRSIQFISVPVRFRVSYSHLKISPQGANLGS